MTLINSPASAGSAGTTGSAQVSGSALIAVGLHKRYGARAVLAGVDLTVARGEVVALVGHNGAGKSTLLGCLVGDVIPDEGRVSVGGIDLSADPVGARRRLRWLPQEVDAPLGLTGLELLDIYADLFDAGVDSQRRARDREVALALSDLDDALGRLCATYSVGMRKRLLLGALAHGAAELYVLDEPFAGLDGRSRSALVEFLQGRRSAGAGVLLAAHDADDRELATLGVRTFAVGASAGS